MDVKRIYAHDNQGTLVCEQCGKGKVINIAGIKIIGEPLKIRCGCGHTFFISIEVRKFYRKKTKLPGEYVQMGLPITNKPDKGRMTVEDLSRSGLGFRTERPHTLQVKDTIRVTFHLDDTKHSEVSARAEVKRVDDSFVGAAFLDLEEYSDANRILGFYLMPR